MSVFDIDWTTTGAPPPTCTGPTLTPTVAWRFLWLIDISIYQMRSGSDSGSGPRLSAMLYASRNLALTAGTRLGPYEILAPLGAGGMGEVYRARDSKLGRDVAIKVLPDAVSEDPERLARFEREAKVLASLNHPHIAAIYGLEESGPHSTRWCSSSSRARRWRSGSRAGPLPVDEALGVARQIAEALEAFPPAFSPSASWIFSCLRACVWQSSSWASRGRQHPHEADSKPDLEMISSIL